MEPDERARQLFILYAEFQDAIKDEGAKAVLDDLQHYYGDLYEVLEAEFDRRQRAKRLGALLVNSM